MLEQHIPTDSANSKPSAAPTVMFRCKLFSDNLGSGRWLLSIVDHMQCETVKSQTFMKKREGGGGWNNRQKRNAATEETR